MFLVFGAALSVHATPVPIIQDYITYYNGIYLGSTLDLTEGTQQPQQDKHESTTGCIYGKLVMKGG